MGRKEQVANQLRALMERHHLTPAEIERRTAVGDRPPISAVTVRRILKAEARTEPEPATLRRIAESVGESYTATFAEQPDGLTVDVALRGARYFLRFLGGTPPDGLEADLRAVLDRYALRPAADDDSDDDGPAGHPPARDLRDDEDDRSARSRLVARR